MTGEIRKRMRRREGTGSWRFVTCSCHRRLPLFDAAPSRAMFVDALTATRARHSFRLLAWVLMPEHFHLMLLPLDAEVSVILHGLKMPLAQRMIREWKATGSRWLAEAGDVQGRARFWQAGGGFDRNVRDEEELWREVEYIHWNPVDRGLAREPTDWEWSSARWWAQRNGRWDGPTGPVEIDFGRATGGGLL